MITKAELWDLVPKEINWICGEDNTVRVSTNRPVYDPNTDGWKVDCNNIREPTEVVTQAILELIKGREDCHNRINLLQRPSTFHGFAVGDVVNFDEEGESFFITALDKQLETIEVATVWEYELAMPFSQVLCVNGLAYCYQKNTPIGLIPEVHNNDPVDGYEAMDILRGMLS